ncbi:MAG: type IV secretory system conjugative DNA transfer family protein [Bacilli bacterium]|nr:type IV secretory system conjugative DNA transfer family protein [Bacilli bacterium]
MKFKFVATPRDIVIFIIFALFLLYVVALGVLNIPSLASEGMFYGLNPIEAFSPEYIGHTLVFYIVALVGLILSVNSYFFEFQEGVGLKISSSSGGGYSDWAKVKDIKTDKNVKRVLASDPKSDYAGVPLISNGHELWVDDGEYHTLVIGATGSGKTQDTILPTIKVLAKKGESVVVTDPKGEIYEKAGGLLKENGYNIILLNFRNPQNGNTWNPLELPYRLYKEGNQDKAIELLDDLALNILYDETNANSDPFWEKTAADYFSGIALAMFEDTTEDKININSINMTATVGEDKFGGSTYIKEYFNMKDPAGAAYVNASGTVMAPNETKGGIISVFKQKVKLFASRENLSEMLSYSDFKLDSIGTQKTAVFIIIQDEKKTYHSLATILIKQIYETLIDVAQEHGGKLPCRTNFLLDEFANMPPLKDVTTMITAARSRQIRFTMIIQNFAQLNKVYGKDDAETIKGNCGNIIYLISTELAALEEISKLCGEKKSKKDDKTASTPLVTVSDLQRMKQFDHIVLRMRKSPFKTSFVPDFKIDWGNCISPKVDYPTREKRKVEIFDIREFVKEKKNQKINEMMKGMGINPKDEIETSSNSGGRMPFPMMSPKNELSVNDLVRKIDEKLAEIEKEEQEEKMKKEQEEKRKRQLESISSNKVEQKEKENVINNITINNYHNEEKNNIEEAEKKSIVNYSKNENVELLDDDFTISSEEIEKKVNEKLKGMKEEVPIAKIEEIDNKKEEAKEIKEPDIKPSISIDSEELERIVNDRITDEIIKKDELARNNKRINSEINKELQDTVNAVLNNSKKEKQVVETNTDLEEKEMIQDIENKLNDLKNDQESYISDFKKTATIKLDDAAKDDNFFDDFFDD